MRRYYAQDHTRNQAFYQSLIHANDDKTTTNPDSAWSDLYLSKIKHDDNGNSSAYEHQITGVSLIQPGELDLIANLQRSTLDIDNGSQEIKSQTLGLGVQHPKLFDLEGQDISARLMLIHGDHDSSQSISGNENHQANYNSMGVSIALGTGFESQQQEMRNNTYLEAELLHERADAHNATDSFTWNDRELTQLSLSAQNLWQYDAGVNDYYLSAGVTLRKLISGETADYQASGNPGSYVDESTDDISLNLGAGINRNIDENTQLHVIADISKSNEDVLGKTLSLGLDWKF